MRQSIFLGLFLFVIFGEGFWEFEWVGWYHELGLSVEVFLVLFVFVTLFLSLHKYILMNKQAYYLPNLNSLHIQNRDYLQHQQRLKQSKSEYQIYNSTDPIAKDGFVAVKQQLFVKMIPYKHSTSREACEEGDLLRVNKSYRMELTPLQKRKYSQQARQNKRIYKAMHILSPRIDRYDKSREQQQSALKDRISKFIKDGSKISYKFKKSLVEVEKRKKEKDDYYSQRSNMIREDARTQLQSIIDKSEKSRSKEHTQGNIYLIGDNELIRKKSGEKLSIFEIINKVKASRKDQLKQQEQTERSQQQWEAPQQAIFSRKHQQVINRKILAYHLQNLKFKKSQEPNKIMQQFKKLKLSSNPSVMDNKLGNKPTKVVDIQVVEITPISYEK